ncbi:MAG TPA: hypothetical protein VKZ73_06480, partial [Microbacterium sp.]|nr:hypothetical protein [Microbacterium sp.]
LRECWCALLSLVIQVPFLAVVVFAQVYDMFRPRLNAWVIVSCPVVLSLLGLIASIFHGVSLAVAG